MGISISTVKINHLGFGDYPPEPAVGFINHLREDCSDIGSNVWRVESEGHVLMQVLREDADSILEEHAESAGLSDEDKKSVSEWLDATFGEDAEITLLTG